MPDVVRVRALGLTLAPFFHSTSSQLAVPVSVDNANFFKKAQNGV
jgi:hypothetical protein